MTKSLHDFIEELVKAGGPARRRYFHPTVLTRWLEDNKWVEGQDAPCAWCQHMNEVTRGEVSQETCRTNVQAGSSCYREVLRTVFVPFVKAALRGEVPDINPDKVVYKKGSIWQGLTDMKLSGIMDHELGGTLMHIADKS